MRRTVDDSTKARFFMRDPINVQFYQMPHFTLAVFSFALQLYRITYPTPGYATEFTTP